MHAYNYITEIHQRIEPSADSIGAASFRADIVREASGSFPGALRTYAAGSLATGSAIDPVSDGDVGLVMDRRSRPELGPDGGGQLPAALVDELHGHIRPRLADRFPKVRVERMKRGLMIRFNQPLPSGEDPSVDLVVALNRKADDALWIPNLDRDRWDASHPEKHVELFTSGADALLRTRRQVVHLAKAQVQQFDSPHLCSFNIAALAWECIREPERIDLALLRFFRYAAAELARRLTRDPAGVSDPIRVKDRELAVERLKRTAEGLEAATRAGCDENAVLQALAAQGVFWKFLASHGASEPSALFAAVCAGRPLAVGSTGALVAGTLTPGSVPLKSTRAYGGPRHRDPGPWYGRAVDRLKFEGAATTRVPGLRSIKPRGGGWRYMLAVNPLASAETNVTIEFTRKNRWSPRVTVDGPQESPHRYSDGSLCMWHPRDPLDRRWDFKDGLLQLIGQIQLHLIREDIWRKTGVWAGDEAPHEPEGKT